MEDKSGLCKETPGLALAPDGSRRGGGVTPEERDRIDFILGYLNNPEHVSEFSEKQLDLLISFTAQWERKRWLSDRQLEILEEFWRRAQ